MKNKLYFCIILFAVFTALFAGAGTAQANCKSGVCATLITAGGNGQPSSAKVTNQNSVTTKVAFYTYKVFIKPYNEGWANQELYREKVIDLAPGATQTVSIDTPDCMAQFDVHVGYPAQTEQTILIGLFSSNNNLCVRTPVTVSGKVTKCGQGVSGISIETCGLGTAHTDSNGNWLVATSAGQGYCARASADAKAVNNVSCQASATTYEWQIAGQNRFTNCADGEIYSWDRDSDNNVDFVIPCPCTDECTVMDQRVCSGSGWKQCGNYDSDSCKEWGPVTNCASDEICNNGSCIKNCTDECTLNQHQCSGSSGRTCGIFGSTCTSWGPYQLCDPRCYTCGDNRCDCGETRSTCPQDCGYNTPTVDLNYSGSVKCNQTATLTWSSTNADSCAASGSWSGSKGTGGSESVGNFTGSRVFTLTCSNSGGSASDSVTLTGTSDELEVSAGPDKEVYDSNSVRLDGSVDGDYDSLSWSCTGGSLSDSDIEDPTWRIAPYYYDYNSFGNNYNYDRTYTCTLTARNECGSDSDTMTIRVRRENEPNNFNVSLTARPQSECAPLNGVDLTATVSNYGSYDYNSNYGYTYYFDCENDGNWDKTVTSNNTSYTAYDICDYRNPGIYTAKVRVDSRGRTATDTQTVEARNCQIPVRAGRVNIQKLVRNLTDGTAYQVSATANPAETVSYKIVLTGVEGITDNISLIDAIPANIVNVRDVLVDGIAAGGSLASGINLGSLAQGQTKTVTFNATVAGDGNFTYGQTALTNVATINTSGGSASASATVYVYRNAVQGATVISTGFGGNMFAGLGMAVAGALVALYFAVKQFLAKKKLTAEEKLARKINFIKRNDLA